MIKYKFKQNHAYTTPGATQGFIDDILKSGGMSFDSVFEGIPEVQDGRPAVRGTGCSLLTNWYFYTSDINIVKKKPTIIIEV